MGARVLRKLAGEERMYLIRLLALHDEVLDPVGKHARFYGKV